MPRLSEEQVRCIESLLSMGKHYREIADSCGVSLPTVVKYARRVRGAAPVPTSSPAAAPVTPGAGSEVVKLDTKFFMDLVRQRLDPKHPIMAKWVDNVSWWNHVIIEFSAHMLPYAFKLLEDHEIDRQNPEVTVRNMVSKFHELKKLAEERAEKMAEYESRLKELESEVGNLRAERERLLRLVDEYKGLVDETLSETRKLVEELRSKVVKTLVLVVKVVPETLSPAERAKYFHVVAPKIRELWGVEVG
ncbi:MAG: hypothetical protein DRJ38_04515 [Thermoprotei archaeon]|nr:MAG: hypothetical protein DRJ38_04515 [Thermoprotei archaeon]